MCRFEKKLIHLTSEHSEVDLLGICSKNDLHYVRHTAPPELLRFDIDSQYVILKDRYPHSVASIVQTNVPLISLLPSNVFVARGRNSLAKTVASGLPLCGSIFLLKSVRYSIFPLEILTFKRDAREMTLREAFDYVFDGIYEALPKILRFDDIHRISATGIKINLEEDVPSGCGFFNELESVNFGADIRFPKGLDTPCADVQKAFST